MSEQQREIFPGSGDFTPLLTRSDLVLVKPRQPRLLAVVSENNVPFPFDPLDIPVSSLLIGDPEPLNSEYASKQIFLIDSNKPADGQDRVLLFGEDGQPINTWEKVMAQKRSEAQSRQAAEDEIEGSNVIDLAAARAKRRLIQSAGPLTGVAVGVAAVGLFVEAVFGHDAYAQGSQVEGHNFQLISNPDNPTAMVTWSGGVGQLGHHLWQGLPDRNWQLSEVQPQPPSSVSTMQVTPQEFTCYALVVDLPGGSSDITDVLCKNPIFPPQSQNPLQIGLLSHESNTITVFGSQPNANLVGDSYVWDLATNELAQVPGGTLSKDFQMLPGLNCFVRGINTNGVNGNWIAWSEAVCAMKFANFSNIIATPDATPTLSPTRPASATLTPRPTDTLIVPSRTATPSPTVLLVPATFNYDIGLGVPSNDSNNIKVGFDRLQSELQTYYGGPIMRPANNPIPVRIIANGQGNTDPGGDGACCVAIDESGPHPFFDVLSPDWTIKTDILKQKIATHEGTHDWYYTLNCGSLHSQPLPAWIDEGVAEFIGYGSLIHNGTLNSEVTRYQQYLSAKQRGLLNMSLQAFESVSGSSMWPGDIGYLAIDNLVSHASSGPLSLRSVCAMVGNGSSADQAIQSSFGVNRLDYYQQQFPAYLQSLRSSPIYLHQLGRLPDGSLQIPPGSTAAIYQFDFVAYGYEDLNSAQQFAAWTWPQQMCATDGGVGGKMLIALCNAPLGDYPLSVHLPDGRSAQVTIHNSDATPIASAAAPH